MEKSENVPMTMSLDPETNRIFKEMCYESHRSHIGQLRYFIEKELKEKEKVIELNPQ